MLAPEWVDASRWKKNTYLFAPVTMMMGRTDALEVDIMRVLYVEVAVAVASDESSCSSSVVRLLTTELT